MKQILCNIFC